MRFKSIVHLSLITLLLYACQKEMSVETGNPSNPAGNSGSLRAKINSTQWNATKVIGASRFAGMINLTGISNDRKLLTISLTDSGVHRYILSDVTINGAAFIDSTESNLNPYTTNQGTYPAQSGGEVNITAIDTVQKTMSGTFAFKLFRYMDGAAKTISEGSFTNLPYASSLPPAAATDTFNVKINGTSWKAEAIEGFVFSNQIVVNATNLSATKALGLIFPSNIQPGTYTFDLFGATYMAQYNPDLDPSHAKPAVSGTLTIIEHNATTKRIRGNFAFRGEEILAPTNFAELSEGYFSVEYQ